MIQPMTKDEFVTALENCSKVCVAVDFSITPNENKKYMWIDKAHVEQIVEELKDDDVIDAEHTGIVLYIGKLR